MRRPLVDPSHAVEAGSRAGRVPVYEKVDTHVDGVLEPRPVTRWS
jgi:hypothetical protein